jgi:predicted phosphoribosyltransferase
MYKANLLIKNYVMYSEILENQKEGAILHSEKLKKYKNSNSVVLVVPKGGVPDGYTIAKNLELPFEIVLSKKIGHPSNKESAIGAVSLDATLLDDHPNVPQDYIGKEIVRLQNTLRGKYKLYRGNRKLIVLKDKNVILVDDGIATGSTLLASIEMLRKQHLTKIIVAVPVSPYDKTPVFEKRTDEFVYLIASKHFSSVGRFHEDFQQVKDDEVIQILQVTYLIA